MIQVVTGATFNTKETVGKLCEYHGSHKLKSVCLAQNVSESNPSKPEGKSNCLKLFGEGGGVEMHVGKNLFKKNKTCDVYCNLTKW